MKDPMTIEVEYKPALLNVKASQYVKRYAQMNHWLVVVNHPYVAAPYRFPCKPTRKQIRECIRVTYEEWHELENEMNNFMDAEEVGFGYGY